MKTVAFLLGVAGLILSGRAIADDKVIVHEWGTFTSLQDETGRAIGGINVDDEPVPFFVWQYANRMVVSQYSAEEESLGLPPYSNDGKGWMAGDPTVTMRLETPVIYLYPPNGHAPQSVPPLDVHVDFHGGVLSQYYPYAITNGASLNGDIPYLQTEGITDAMTTGLTWQGVRLGVDGKTIAITDPDMKKAPPWLQGEVVDTDDKVWTAPRDVSAPLLGVKFKLVEGGAGSKKVSCAQAEHFLFYRGVGHLESPLQLSIGGMFQGAQAGENGQSLTIGSWRRERFKKLEACWMVQIQLDGSCAFRSPRVYTPEERRLLESTASLMPRPEFEQDSFGQISVTFSPADFSTENLTKLKASMHDALVKEGLYDDEATAMLKTWELSYFKSPGLRFFYLVPRSWTDKVLPLSVTGAPTDITRVMVGRIELVTDAQKLALQRLVSGPCPDLPAFRKSVEAALQSGKIPKDDVAAFYHGEKPLSETGVPVPPLIADYLSLGRFRDALVMDEFQRRPSLALAQFIKDNGIAPYGMKIEGRDVLQLPSDVSLKNPGATWPSPPPSLHL